MLSPRAASEPGLPLISCYVFKASKVSICPWHFSVGILKKGSLKRRPFPLGWARESMAYWWPVMWQRTLTSRTVCHAQGEAAQHRRDVMLDLWQQWQGTISVKCGPSLAASSILLSRPSCGEASCGPGRQWLEGRRTLCHKKHKCFAMEKRHNIFTDSGPKFMKHSKVKFFLTATFI